MSAPPTTPAPGCAFAAARLLTDHGMVIVRRGAGRHRATTPPNLARRAAEWARRRAAPLSAVYDRIERHRPATFGLLLGVLGFAGGWALLGVIL